MKLNTKKKTKTGVQEPEKMSIFKRMTNAVHNETFPFITGAVLVVLAIFVVISYISFLTTGGIDQSVLESATAQAGDYANSSGKLGANLAQLLINKWFGLSSMAIPILMAVIGLRLLKVAEFKLLRWFICCSFLMIWCSIFLQWILAGIMKNSFIIPGGMHGKSILEWLHGNVGAPGIILILMLSMLIFCIYLTRNTIEWVRNRLSSFKKSEISESETDNDISEPVKEENEVPVTNPEPPVLQPEEKKEEVEIISAISDEDDDYKEIKPEKISKKTKSEEPVQEEKDIPMEVIQAQEEEKATGRIQEPYDPRLDLSHYKFPKLDLLKHYENNAPSVDESEQEANKNRIIQTLRNFGIEITSITATVGPTITLFEITPAAGIKINRIKHLEDDIALSLAALGIRIIAPIPGKGTIGIEVPNAKPIIVSMESIIGSKKFAESKFELPVAVGKTITNEVYMFDLAKAPHLLVAGATGQGKSVGLNAIITSLLYKKHPAELKLVMVDPKMVEFSIYSPILKHFLAKLPDEEEAIITDTSKVIQTLKSLCIEMDDRYMLLKEAGVRTVIEYNEKFKNRELLPTAGHRYMPYIVVIIDEYGDLIMTAGKEVEMPIARIAQKARAVGMHMIIATQRPTTNIVTGTIKANFPARMSFKTTSMIDSKTILDRTGANQLIGRGDMLYLQGSDCVRVQCAFVDTPEVTNICNYIKNQQGYTDAYLLPEVTEESDSASTQADSFDSSKLDSLFEEAARLIVIHQQGSTSLIQRKFAIGYNRAGRLMDQLEKAGIVGKADGSKPRQVLCGDEMDLDRILENLR
ncbi:MAG: DNA translocase FtsK [Bacteroidaceae bacterium]|nr:DNA translocase FtsK [Bacteroidaceae bacterium]